MYLNFVFLGILGPTELILIISIFGSVFLFLVPFIFYLVTLQDTLNTISVPNRRMDPAQVWLSLIPIFGLVWQFIIVNRMADSLRDEFLSKSIPLDEDRPGSGIGTAYSILFSIGIIPFLGILTTIAGIICWIMYWVKINDYRLKLHQAAFAVR